MTSECIEWGGSKDTSGYGQKRINKRLYRTHRLSLCQFLGLGYDAISGLDVLHSCDNPACVNPRHLSLGTRADNNADRAAKDRSAKAVPSRRKITQAQAEEIRRRYIRYSKDSNAVTLAKEYGVDHTTIHNILRRRTHV